jgi:hypothetical protein
MDKFGIYRFDTILSVGGQPIDPACDERRAADIKSEKETGVSGIQVTRCLQLLRLGQSGSILLQRAAQNSWPLIRYRIRACSSAVWHERQRYGASSSASLRYRSWGFARIPFFVIWARFDFSRLIGSS